MRLTTQIAARSGMALILTACAGQTMAACDAVLVTGLPPGIAQTTWDATGCPNSAVARPDHHLKFERRVPIFGWSTKFSGPVPVTGYFSYPCVLSMKARVTAKYRRNDGALVEYANLSASCI
ncbi:MAG: hypothetical protein HUU30_16435 [Burkholderiaceae bacterium]|nr:hypothetical protein [Aquabacterium sp.]NUP87321.1 hypothetical protein [Burkholderiaceae bacterium]